VGLQLFQAQKNEAFVFPGKTEFFLAMVERRTRRQKFRVSVLQKKGIPLEQ
jgi:hypothetical protein